MERDLLRALPVVSRGGTLVEAFSTSRYMSRMGKEMLSVGEQSGDLDTALQKAAEYSFGEAQAAVRSAAKVLQVVITLIVGGVVAYFVISFYSSLYGSALNGL
ncbi:MAG TPA: type II secretion system F family protein [bacterium]|nr:type II secretion system F family protein [bacterium]